LRPGDHQPGLDQPARTRMPWGPRPCFSRDGREMITEMVIT